MLILAAILVLGSWMFLFCVVWIFMSRMTRAERLAVVSLITILTISAAVILWRSHAIRP